jgi:hypothetical protein
MLGYSSLNERQIREGIGRVSAALERSQKRGAPRPSSAQEASPVAATLG